jgi:hypothetical protein
MAVPVLESFFCTDSWLRDESFDLDLIGLDATDMEPILAR